MLCWYLMDLGETFKDMKVDPDPRECDVHRVLINPQGPDEDACAVGLVGLMRSIDGGVTWTARSDHAGAGVPGRIPAAILTGRRSCSLQQDAAGRSTGTSGIVQKAGSPRSKDGGATWERLLGGLPRRAAFALSAISLQAYANGYELFAVDTEWPAFSKPRWW